MQVQFGKRKKIQFTDRSHPLPGILSVVMGVVSLGMLVALCVISGNTKGNSGLAAGAWGMLALGMSAAGFIMAVKCYRKEDIYMVTPTAGSILNGILVLLFLLLFFIGAM